jgi:hypothetical protein
LDGGAVTLGRSDPLPSIFRDSQTAIPSALAVYSTVQG